MSAVAAGARASDAYTAGSEPWRAATPPRTICLAACEVSGDRNAAHLARAIRRAAPDVRLVGIGGPAMQAAAVDVRVHTTDLGFMGVAEGVRIVPEMLRLFRDSQRLIREERPDLVVLIDSEFVTTPFAVWLRRQRVTATRSRSGWPT